MMKLIVTMPSTRVLQRVVDFLARAKNIYFIEMLSENTKGSVTKN